MNRTVRPSRRQFLRGAAGALPLPWLPSLLPRSAWGATLAPPQRLLFFYVPCGLQPEEFVPDRLGAGYDLKQITAPLVDVQADVSVLSGLVQGAGYDNRPGDHARGTGCFLTATTVKFTAGSDIENGISVDQVAAQAVGSATLLPSLQLGIDEGGTTGDCDSGYSCAYARNISWAGPSTPMPNVIDPTVAFNRLFAGTDLNLDADEVARRTLLRTSVLDHVAAQATALSGRMAYSDRLKLDEYLTGVRDLELKIEQLANQVCLPGESPPIDDDYAIRVQAMCDLMALAYSCDLTRFITFMLGNGGSNRSYGHIGVAGAHHELSHHQGDPAKLADLYAIGNWEVAQFAYLVGKLRDLTDADGSRVIDNSLLYFSSEIEDGNSHSHTGIPVLLAGGGGGAHTPGRHLDFGETAPMADLFLAMLDAVGVNPGTFGEDGTAPLAGLR